MLVLSRKVNEEVLIGENIRITVVRVAGNRIRLGISAPADVTIRRSEIAFDGEETPDLPELIAPGMARNRAEHESVLQAGSK